MVESYPMNTERVNEMFQLIKAPARIAGNTARPARASIHKTGTASESPEYDAAVRWTARAA
jgi:hypothetical protein